MKFCIEKESKWLIIKFSRFCHWDENCPFKLNVLSQCVGLYWVFIEMLSAHKYPYCSQRLWLSPESALLTALQLYWCITQYLFTKIWISISQWEVFNHGIHVSDMSDRSVLKNCWWHFKVMMKRPPHVTQTLQQNQDFWHNSEPALISLLGSL